MHQRARPTYFPAFDGLRFVSCTAVIVCHVCAGVSFAGILPTWLEKTVHGFGRLGVEIFFSLSGFLITYLLLQERGLLGTIDLRRFYIRRSLRIWPVYYLAIALGYAIIAYLNRHPARVSALGYSPTPGSHEMTAGLLASLLFVRNWIAWPLPSTVLPLWSLCVEEQFYLFWPMAVAMSSRKYPVVRPAVITLALCVSSRILLAATGHTNLIYFNTLAHGEHLVLGALLAQWVSARPRHGADFGSSAEVLAATAALALPAFVYVDPSSVWEWGWTYALPPLVTTALVGAFIPGKGTVSRLLRLPIVSRLGRLTYAAYVVHQYCIAVCWTLVERLHVGPLSSAALRLALSLPLTFAIAWISWIVMEGRLARLRRQFEAGGGEGHLRPPAGLFASEGPAGEGAPR